MDNLCTVELHTLEYTRALLWNLLLYSAWFEVLPFPDDVWRITVKSELRSFVEKYGVIV